MRSRISPLLMVLVFMGTGAAGCQAKPGPVLAPLEVTLPSAEPSGNPINDQIWVTFYPAVRSTEQPAPAVVLLHALGETRLKLMSQFARYLAERGIGSAVMMLPYHMRRRPPGERSGGRFTSSELGKMAQVANQSVSDVSTVVTWLSRQPSVDPHRIGIVGISLGALIAHLAMGKDERLSAGVAILGGGNLLDLYRHSLVFRLQRYYNGGRLDPAAAAQLRQIDPLEYAGRNRPRKVLMIEAARDLLMPPRDALALWAALGHPPIHWVDTNHFGLVLTTRPVMRTSAAYLHSVWDPGPLDDPPLPATPALTLKLGMVAGLDGVVTPAIQWQVYSFITRRDHMSFLHADLGWSGRGAFIGLATTLNAFLDVGLGHRFNDGGIRPYVSLHIVF